MEQERSQAPFSTCIVSSQRRGGRAEGLRRRIGIAYGITQIPGPGEWPLPFISGDDQLCKVYVSSPSGCDVDCSHVLNLGLYRLKLGTHYTMYWMICRYEANRSDKSSTRCSVYALYMAPTVRNDVLWSAVHAAESHDIVSDTMRSAVRHQDLIPDRGYTLCIVYQALGKKCLLSFKGSAAPVDGLCLVLQLSSMNWAELLRHTQPINICGAVFGREEPYFSNSV